VGNNPINRQDPSGLEPSYRDVFNKCKDTRTPWGAPVPPPNLTPDEKKCCENAGNALLFPDPSSIGQPSRCQAAISAIVSALLAGDCPKPRVECRACGEGGTREGPVVIVCGSPDPASLCTTVWHELIHIYQDCHAQYIVQGLNQNDWCPASLRAELQAYYCSGDCDGISLEDCFMKALVSSCSSECTPGPAADNYRKTIAWFRSKLETQIGGPCAFSAAGPRWPPKRETWLGK
jgi:hypothetical protein